MGLLASYLQSLPGQRLKELTNSENAGGMKDQALAGTVTVTAGSAAVLGAGTNFVTSGLQALVQQFGAVVVQFGSQPGVSYVVSAVADDTHLTLAASYAGLTAAGASAVLPGINYGVLQQSIFFAEQHFVTATNFPFDDLTQNAAAAGAVTALNKCIWAGVSLVTAYLYEARGRAWPEAEIDKAWQIADKRLAFVRANYGDGAFAGPVTDSVFTPSTGPQRLPDMDNERFGDISPNAPGPGPSSTSGFEGGASVESWGW